MTNKPILSVELRALLERLLSHDFAEECQECGIGYSDAWGELRALLDTPSECRCKRYGKDNPHWPCPVHAEPAAQNQDINPGWPDPLESTLAKEIINNPAAFDLAIRDLFDKLCREIQAGRYYRRFSGSEPMEFIEQPAPEVVAMPDNLVSHRNSWLQAMERLVALEAEATPATHDSDEAGYWEHELKAMRAMYADLDRLNGVKP